MLWLRVAPLSAISALRKICRICPQVQLPGAGRGRSCTVQRGFFSWAMGKAYSGHWLACHSRSSVPSQLQRARLLLYGHMWLHISKAGPGERRRRGTRYDIEACIDSSLLVG